MNLANQHIIQKQVFDLELHGIEDGFALQRTIEHICQDKLGAMIEDLFDRYVTIDELVELDELSLDLGWINHDTLETDLVEKVTKALEMHLEKVIKTESPQIMRRPIAQSKFEAWLFFLKNGYFLWHVGTVEEQDLEASILLHLENQIEAIQKLATQLKTDSNSQKRLILQSTDVFLAQILSKLTAQKQAALPTLQTFAFENLQVIEQQILASAASIKLKKATQRIFKSIGFREVTTLKKQCWEWIFQNIQAGQQDNWDAEKAVLHFLKSELLPNLKKQLASEAVLTEFLTFFKMSPKALSALEQSKSEGLVTFFETPQILLLKDFVGALNVAKFSELERSVSKIKAEVTSPSETIQKIEEPQYKSENKTPHTTQKETSAKRQSDSKSLLYTSTPTESTPQEIAQSATEIANNQIDLPNLASQENHLPISQAPLIDLSKTKHSPPKLEEESRESIQNAKVDFEKMQPSEQEIAEKLNHKRTADTFEDNLPSRLATAIEKLSREKVDPPESDTFSTVEGTLEESEKPPVFSLQNKEQPLEEDALSEKEKLRTDQSLIKKRASIKSKTLNTLSSEKENQPQIAKQEITNTIPTEKKSQSEIVPTGIVKNQSVKPTGRTKNQINETNQPIKSLEEKKDSIIESQVDSPVHFDKTVQSPTDRLIIKKEESPVIRSTVSFPDLSEGTSFYIQQAGVILIHPFLSTFFKEFDLLEGKDFKNEATQERAAHLIQFLATGNMGSPEYEMLLPKFLCNIPFDHPLKRQFIATAKEKAEAENLLSVVIQHWGVLGSASPDGLREGFFQRDGKLVKREQGWYLQVEQKTIDLLLDKLPWGVSMVMLPWREEVLRVEWG